jgi:hypothetical protein
MYITLSTHDSRFPDKTQREMASQSAAVLQWLQIAKKQQKIFSLDVISRVLPCKFLQIQITSVSGCLRFTFKMYQIVAGISMILQFHEFSFLSGF